MRDAPRSGEEAPAPRGGLAAALAAAVLPLVGAMALVAAVTPTLASREFPWITGRALGLAAYLALTGLVVVGLWFRHPWRLRTHRGHPESLLRVHATLGVATVALVAAHLVVLATDRWAGVGWSGALVPGQSHYRTLAVGLGVVAMYLLALVGATARFAGAPGARHWRTVHRLAVPSFAVAWLHGVLAGADTQVLRPVYLVTGGAVAALLLGTRASLAPQPESPVDRRVPADQ